MSAQPENFERYNSRRSASFFISLMLHGCLLALAVLMFSMFRSAPTDEPIRRGSIVLTSIDENQQEEFLTKDDVEDTTDETAIELRQRQHLRQHPHSTFRQLKACQARHLLNRRQTRQRWSTSRTKIRKTLISSSSPKLNWKRSHANKDGCNPANRRVTPYRSTCSMARKCRDESSFSFSTDRIAWAARDLAFSHEPPTN